MNCECECCVRLAALLRARRDWHEDLASEINCAMVEAGFVAEPAPDDCGDLAKASSPAEDDDEPQISNGSLKSRNLDEPEPEESVEKNSRRQPAEKSIHFKAIHKALSEGPKTKKELEDITGKQSACFAKVLEYGPFEKVDPNNKFTKWRLKA